MMWSEYFLHTALAICSVAVGALLCAVYDLFRAFRLRKKQNAILLFVLDFIYCIIAAVFMLLLFFNLSYGKARVYAFVLAFCGFMIWRLTISKLFSMIMIKILNFIEKILSSTKNRLFSLVLWIWRRIYTKKYCRGLIKKAKSGKIVKKKGILK